MKTTASMFAAFTLIAGAQNLPPRVPSQPNPVDKISREVKSPRWICSDNHIFDDVKVLEINGAWAKIEYSVFVPPRPVVVDANAKRELTGPAQRPRAQTWVNTLHVIRIESSAKLAPEEK
ncbi:hypothetical protein ACFQY0_21170 [Haloferula chungangensis]|uniref:PGF-CTERM sorting domain-containing protein n=1 Tax=Haloferula chungangensis TaxID=1048331 RepID=A0ABW2LDS0_9BACT